MKRKWLKIGVLCSLLFTAGCSVNDDKPTGTEVAEKTEMMESEKNIGDEVKTEVLDETVLDEVYHWKEITVTIPAEWQGKYLLKENENGFSFYQKASYEKEEGMGYLCGIQKCDEYLNIGAGETLLAYSDDGEFYYFHEPTDVACYLEDEKIAGEYHLMMQQAAWIAKSIQITAENVFFDANQYQIPFSSRMLLEETQLMNLSERELWIARNEIYARHGKLFKNAYLSSYFNSCSWYQGIEGKNEVAENELSAIERENIKRIVAAEKEFARIHPYPKQYETGMEAVESLEGTSALQTISYEVTADGEWEYQCILTIDNVKYDLNDYVTLISPVEDAFYIVNLAEYEAGLEVAILDNGPSEDPITYFFGYDGDLYYLGEVYGFPFKEYENTNRFTHQNGIIGQGSVDLIETAYVDDYYWYDSTSSSIEYMELGMHQYQSFPAHELFMDLPLYILADEDAPTVTLKAQKEVFFIKTDKKEWILVRGKDGTEGYIQIKDGQIQNLGLPAEKLFSDLYFFG